MEMYISAEYRQRKREFKNSCRIYISEKSHLLSLEKKYPFLKNEPATEDSAILHVGIFLKFHKIFGLGEEEILCTAHGVERIAHNCA